MNFINRIHLALALVPAAALALTGPAPALAATAYPSFAGSGTDALSGPTDVAIDEASQDLYVTDPGHFRVEKFSSSGHFILMFGKAVNKTKVDEIGSTEAEQNVCTAASANTCQAGALGSSPGEFSTPTFVTVDNSGGPSAGDVYVGDTGDNLVSKFDSGGNLVASWGVGGQLNGSAATGGPFIGIAGITTDSSGNLFVYDPDHNWFEFSQAGIHDPTVSVPRGTDVAGIAVDSSGNLYKVVGAGNVERFSSAGIDLGAIDRESSSPTGFAFDPSIGDLYIDSAGGTNVEHFTFNGSGNVIEPDLSVCTPTPESGCLPDETITSSQFKTAEGLAVSGSSGQVYLANTGDSNVVIIGPMVIIPNVSTGAATNVRHTTATVTGTVEQAGGDPIIQCKFNFVTEAAFSEHGFLGASAENCTQSTPLTGDQAVSANLTGLKAEEGYDYRLVAGNDQGSNEGEAKTLHTAAVFEVSTGPASDTTPESATLTGSLNPDGIATEYFFQYGVENTYGQTTATQNAGSGMAKVPVTGVEIDGLEPHHTYHYRIVATNEFGTTVGQDETFETPSPPLIDGFGTSGVTATSAELHAEINPEGFSTTYHFEYGPTRGYGTSTPMAEAGSGTSVETHSVTLEHLEARVYHFRVVAENKWGTTTTLDQTFSFYPEKCPNGARREETHSNFLPDCRAYELVSPSRQGSFIVFPGDAPATSDATNPARFSFAGGFGAVNGTNPPTGLYVDNYVATRTDTGWVTKYAGLGGETTIAATGIVGDLSFDKVIDFDRPNGCFGCGGVEPESKAPYVWSASGESLGRWPENVGSTPYLKEADEKTLGDWQPSPDFSHLAYSSNNFAWETGGLTVAPGSAYEYNTDTHSSEIISILPAGGDIPQQPGQTNPQEWIRFPGGNGEEPAPVNPSVSTDGSHVLMSTAGPSGGGELYMRIDELATFCVSCNSNGEPSNVNYVGMTSDGSKVFFTSNEQLTNEDTDHSTDLYMWSEATNTLTDVSLGNNGAGNTDTCTPAGGWTTACDVVPVVPGDTSVGDTSLAHESGDIYFYSPEQLDQSKGIPNQVNLYLYKGGQVHYVTTFSPGTDCEPTEEGSCGNGPIGRMNVSPDGSHMAFITNQRLSGYESNGYDEMYSYEPSAGKMLCVSCDPSGDAPVGGVSGADDGLFMSNDGRTFFYTPDALVPGDTNNLHDVYEYVDGRPQLISSGTSAQDVQQTANQTRTVGLAGVSADGVNVYFSTFATLVAQDENGPFAKYYDARVDGGFPVKPETLPCEAADECHGSGSSPPAPPQFASSAEDSSGGNWLASTDTHSKKKHKRKRHIRHVRRQHARHGVRGHQ